MSLDQSRRREFLASSATVVVASFAGCSGEDSPGEQGGTSSPTEGGGTTNPDSKEPLRMGSLLPFSGNFAWVGENFSSPVPLVQREIEQTGGINGRQLKTIRADTEATPSTAVSATKKLVNVENVDGILGPTSLTISAVFDLLVENKAPTILGAGTAYLDERGGKYVFRVTPSSTLGGRAIARGARNKSYNGTKDYSRMSVMLATKENFQVFKDPLTRTFENVGGTIASTIDFNVGKSSYKSEARKMIESDPGVTVLAGPQDDTQKIMQAAFQSGYEGNWFLTVDSTTAEFLNGTSPKLTDGILGTRPTAYKEATETGRVQEFRERIKDEHGHEPKTFSKNGFDGLNIWTLAAKAAATAGKDVNRATITENIPKISKPPGTKVTTYTEGANALDDGKEINYQGLTGPMNFDEYGNIAAPFDILKASEDAWNQTGYIPPTELS